MFQFNIAIYLTIFLLSIIGCQGGCERLSTTTFSDTVKGNGKPLIVLFHGLSSNASCFEHLKSIFESSFTDAEVVALTSVEGNRTVTLSMHEQANESFNELFEEIGNLRDRPTILIGHSQGGLRAYKMFELYKDKTNIKAIITLATPWEGTPALRTTESLTLEFLEPPVLDDIRKLSIALSKPADWAEEYFSKKLDELKTGSAFPGCNDLNPGSDFLEWVKKALPSVEVPILAIGGGQSDVRVFLTQESNHDFKALNNLWTKLIVDENDYDKRHDMVVPLSSQLALNSIPEGNIDFERYFIADALHDQLLSEEASTASAKNILVHSKMVKKVKNFIRRILYGSQSANKPHNTR